MLKVFWRVHFMFPQRLGNSAIFFSRERRFPLSSSLAFAVLSSPRGIICFFIFIFLFLFFFHLGPARGGGGGRGGGEEGERCAV